jgi:SAM-dependent methyltransferase
MKSRLESYFWSRLARTDFDPGRLGILVNPFYFARKGLREHVAALAVHVTGATLDVGCGTKPYESLCMSSSYVGLEVDSAFNRRHSKAEYFYDGSAFPFLGEEFDSVLVNQVFEHVFTPDQFLAEIYRVLKPGGVLLMTVPFVWDEHLQPNDFARYSSFGITYLLETHGFGIVEARKSVSDVRVVFQLMNDYTYKVLRTDKAPINLLSTVFLMAPVNIIGQVMSWVLPANGDLYLDNVILARKGS